MFVFRVRLSRRNVFPVGTLCRLPKVQHMVESWNAAAWVTYKIKCFEFRAALAGIRVRKDAAVRPLGRKVVACLYIPAYH